MLEKTSLFLFFMSPFYYFCIFFISKLFFWLLDVSKSLIRMQWKHYWVDFLCFCTKFPQFFYTGFFIHSSLFEFIWVCMNIFCFNFCPKHKDKKLIWFFFSSSLANLKSCAWCVFSDRQSWSVLEAVGWLWMNFWLRMIHAEVIFLIISNQK